MMTDCNQVVQKFKKLSFVLLTKILTKMANIIKECYYHNAAARLTSLRIKKSLSNMCDWNDPDINV